MTSKRKNENNKLSKEVRRKARILAISSGVTIFTVGVIGKVIEKFF